MIMIRESDLDRIEMLLTIMLTTPELNGRARTEVSEILSAIAAARRGYPKLDASSVASTPDAKR